MEPTDPVRRELLSTGTATLAVGLILMAVYLFIPGGPCVYIPIGMLGLVATVGGALYLFAAAKLPRD